MIQYEGVSDGELTNQDNTCMSLLLSLLVTKKASIESNVKYILLYNKSGAKLCKKLTFEVVVVTKVELDLGVVMNENINPAYSIYDFFFTAGGL